MLILVLFIEMEDAVVYEEVERPVRHTLFRQSSLETRLYPSEDTSDMSDNDSETEDKEPRKREDSALAVPREVCENAGESSTRPRVVSMVAKTKPQQPTRRITSEPSAEKKPELQPQQRPLQQRAQGTLDLTETAADVEYAAVQKKKSTAVDSTLVIARPCVDVASSQQISTHAEHGTAAAIPAKEVVSTESERSSGRADDKNKSDVNKKENSEIKSQQEPNEKVAEKVTIKLERNISDEGEVVPTGEATLRRVRFENTHEPEGEYAEINLQTGVFTASLKAVPVTSSPNMASPRPKSPRPANVSARGEKEESFWEKIGTLGRKKRIKEVQEVQDEGKYAIDSPGNPLAPDLPPEDYALEENEERSMISPQSYEDPRLRDLMSVLTEWINDELASHRIIVKDLEQDLYDGQVLHKLIETLTGERLDVPEVTQSEEGQRQKLGVVLATANRVLGLPRWSQQKWSVESIHSKNVISILHLLVALARFFRAPVRLPERVAVQVVVVQMHNGVLSHRTVTEEITSTYDDLGQRGERDAFDTLFDHAPDKLQVVKKSLVTFVNKHLNKLGLEVSDLDTQFHDGVYLALLMGLLEGFFVPLYAFHNTPHDFDQKVHNVSLAFDLMQEVGLARPKARPEDIVNLDLKSTLRVLYNLFTKYKSMS
ncbi:hypothetical protein B566_EDAN002237 [Ephemera danica]|nr:hypothetical protein B566_EDAN002237 [Ephemera danica]